jgi:hypothetical protein
MSDDLDDSGVPVRECGRCGGQAFELLDGWDACRRCGLKFDLVRAGAEHLGGILERVQRFIRRFVALTEAQAVAITLWVAMTYVTAAFEVVGHLHIYSPEKRSGKTRLLDVLAVLVLRPMLAADMTSAVLFRVLDGMRPTVLFDEVDVIFAGKGERADELRGLLNAGYKRGGAAWRVEMNGKVGVPRAFDVFGPKALAGIGSIPDTIADRCHPIAMARQLRASAVERFRTRGKLEETVEIRDGLAAWAKAAVEALAVARPQLPDELNDREQDIWEPLLAIAEQAGDGWPSRARAAALELHRGGGESEATTSLLLLRHIRELFAEQGDPTALSSESIMRALADNDEGPWGRWWVLETDHGRRSAASGLARLLRPFGIASTKIKTAGASVRGYRRDGFSDAWTRYLPEIDGTNGTDGTPQVGATSEVPWVPEVPSTPQEEPH